MSTHIDTSDGTWRQVTEAEWATAAADSLRTGIHGSYQHWVRKGPVPALPTEPHHVIRCWTKSGNTMDCVLRPDGSWADLYGVAVRDVQRAERFEVLSEPRAVTAKAIRDDLERANWSTSRDVVDPIFARYGVTS